MKLLFCRRAFESLERDYQNWFDECITQQVQNMDQIRDSNEQAALQVNHNFALLIDKLAHRIHYVAVIC